MLELDTINTCCTKKLRRREKGKYCTFCQETNKAIFCFVFYLFRLLNIHYEYLKSHLLGHSTDLKQLMVSKQLHSVQQHFITRED